MRARESRGCYISRHDSAMMTGMSSAPLGASRPDPMALVGEAVKKSSVAWLSVAGAPARAVWFVNEGSDLLLVTGGAEQEVPGLGEAGEIPTRLTLRSKDTNARLVEVEVEVTTLVTDSEQWTAAAKALSPKRLNGVSEDLTAQWRETASLFRLKPTVVVGADGIFAEASEALASDGSYEELRQSPAGTGRPIPFHIGKRTRRKQGT